MATIQELRQIISQDYLRDPNHRVFPVATVDRAINKWITRLEQDLFHWLWVLDLQATFQTVPWQMEYTLPVGWVKMTLVKWDGTEMIQTTLSQIQKENDQLTQGSPFCYYIRWWVLWLYSIPDRAWEIYIIYNGKSDTVDESTDYVLPQEWIDAVLAFAASRLFNSVGKFDFAWEYRNHYQDEVNKIRWMYQYNDENLSFWYQRWGSRPSEKSLSYNE